MTLYEPSLGVEVLFSILDVLAAISNLVVMVLILHKPSLRTVSNLLVCGLAFTDFLVAVLIVPFSILGYKRQSWLDDGALCVFHGFMYNMLYIIAGTFTSVVSVDRYYSLASPMSHTANVTRTHLVWITMFVIVHSAFWASLPLFSIEGLTYLYLPREARCGFTWAVAGPLGIYLFFIVLVTFAVPLIGSIIMYYKSVQAAMDSARKIRPGNVQIERFGNGDFTSVAKTEHIGSSKAVCTVSVIVGSFVLSRAPILVCNIGAWFTGEDLCSAKIELGFAWLQYLGVLTNPYVYTFLNRRLRSELKGIIKSWASFNDNSDEQEPKDILEYLRDITNNESSTSALPAQQRNFSVGTSRFSTEIETLHFQGTETNCKTNGSREMAQTDE